MTLWTRMVLGVLACVLLAATLSAQGPPVAEWSFDADVGEWASMDPNAQLSITTDANVAREDGGGCLEYTYTPGPGVFSGVMTPLTAGIGGARSLHFWVKSTDPALVVVLLAEGDGSRYITLFYCLPERWQEVMLGVGEFALTDDSEDENGQLDPDQVGAILFADGIAMLAQLAEQMPFIAGPELGPRMLWLDSVAVETEDVPPRWEVTEIDGKRAVRLESFESAPLQWLSLAATGVDISYDQEFVAHGDHSLRMHYELPEGKAFGAMTSPVGVPLAGMKRLRFAVMSEVPIVVMIELKELDESKYNTTVQLEGSDQLTQQDIPLTEFRLADDSQDENGTLDTAQIKELLFADVSAIAQAPVTTNTLWLDDIVFSE